LVLVLLIGAVGCRAGARADGPATAPRSPTAGARATETTAATPTRLDRLLDGLTHAVTDRDRAAFSALVADRDPGFATTAAMIFDNLQRLRPEPFTLRATGRTASLSPQRRAVLGADSAAAEVQVGWAVPGDREPSDQTVWMTTSPSQGGGLRWSGVVDGPDGPRPTPLWWLEPIRVGHNQVATVISGDSVDPRPWLARAVAAERSVADRLEPGRPDSPAAGWNRRLVLIVPDNERLLEQMLGVPRGAESSLAAITWPDGEPVSSAPIRIMINPAATDEGLAARIVLTHEAVHVATASPASAVPSWLVEGFADHIAYQAYPQARQTAAAGLLARVVRSGPPRRLPSDQAFQATGAALDRTYAEAWLACRYLSSTYGQARLLRFYAQVARTRNGEIGPALRSVYRLTPEMLTAGWQDYLRRTAAAGRI
jgi:hypothetical protein